ncbi:MAG: UbiA family prenyltransferase [Planctomycetota bacterium]|nr:UbiA family prenyltransferase [Planctomycetota bacterium]
MSPRIALTLLHVLVPVFSVAGLVTVLQVTWGAALFGPGVMALLAGVVVVYSAERVVERYAELGRYLVRYLLTLSAIGLLVLAWAVLQAPDLLLPVTIPLAAISLAYPPLARIPAAKELAVTLCWTIGIVVLPFIAEEARWGLLHEPAAWAIAALVMAGTLLCDLKDIEADSASDVRSLPVLIGDKWTRLVAAAAALDAVWLAWWGQAYALLLASFLLVWLATRPDWLRRPLLGPILVDATLALPGPIAWLGVQLW